MRVIGRIGFVGLGIALAGCLSGAPVFAGDKPAKAPVEDGSKVKGFSCEPFSVEGSREITEFGGWRAYLAQS